MHSIWIQTCHTFVLGSGLLLSHFVWIKLKSPAGLCTRRMQAQGLNLRLLLASEVWCLPNLDRLCCCASPLLFYPIVYASENGKKKSWRHLKEKMTVVFGQWISLNVSSLALNIEMRAFGSFGDSAKKMLASERYAHLKDVCITSCSHSFRLSYPGQLAGCAYCQCT